MRMLKSATGAEWVMRPTEIKSGGRTEDDKAKLRMVDRSTPPLISASIPVGIRGNTSAN